MFKNNKKEGFGVKQWANGSRYEGNWQNDKMHGQGNFKWDKGDLYEGSYKNGLREGHGTKVWASGTQYTVTPVYNRESGARTREKDKGL